MVLSRYYHIHNIVRLLLAVCCANLCMMSSSQAESDLPDGDRCIRDGPQSDDHLDVMSSSATGDCTSDDKSASAAKSDNLALVVYRPTPLDAFRKETKLFTFVGREIVIKQKWEEIGVAAVVWDAAVVLAEYLERNTNTFALRGKSVIELGAGTGLVSMVAALLGADVIATDRKLALEFLQDNIQENLHGLQRTEDDGACKQSKDTLRTDCVNIKAMELDWGHNHVEFSPVFDYILGADIIYIEDTFKQLLETLRHLATSQKKRATVLLSCRIRYERDVRFLGMMEKHFVVEEIHFDDTRKIKIYKAQLLT